MDFPHSGDRRFFRFWSGTLVELLGSGGVTGLEFYPWGTPTGSRRRLNPDAGPGGLQGCGGRWCGAGAARRRRGAWGDGYKSTEGAPASHSPLPSSRLRSLASLFLWSPRSPHRPSPPSPPLPSSGSPPSPRSSAASWVLGPDPRPPLAGPGRPPPRPPRRGGGPFHKSAARLPPLRSGFTPARCPPGACALRSAAAAAVAATSGSVFLKGNAEAPGVTVGEGTPSRGDPRGR